MGKTWDGRELLPDQSSLALCNVEKGDHHWMVDAVVTVEAAHCPECGVRSTTRHSSYQRQLKDLPVQGRAVALSVRVGRWRCRNSACERRIFCQRLNEVTRKYARETTRFGVVSQLIA